MKKFLGGLFCLLTLFFVFSPVLVSEAASSEQVTINVYNWGEYISDGTDGNLDVNAEFTKRTGIKVNYTTFQSNEALFAKMQSGGTKYDVIIPSDYMVSKMIEKNMLKKLNFSKIPNFDLIDEGFKNQEYDKKNEYSVPYTWGTVGIFYNKKFINKSPNEIDWDILWDEKYKENILMFDNPRDAFAIAQFKLGLSINSNDEKDWEKSAQELKRQKPLVQSYVMDQIFDKMGNEEAFLAPYYSGDAAALLKRNKNLGFVIPKNGTNKFIDAMCIPANSQYPDEAMQYINFMCDPEIAVENISVIGYSSPQSIVKNKLPKEISENEIFYPSDEILKSAGCFVNLDENINTLIDDLWIEVKTGERGNPIGLVLVLLGFLLVYLFVIFRKNKKI